MRENNRRQNVRGFLLAMMFAVALTSQAQVTTGTISGTISDSSGAVLPGAKVVILNEGTGASRTVTTDATGHYSAPSLGVGNYRVTGSMEGFQAEARSGIVLTVGREAIVNMSLQVGAVTQTVEVTGEAPLVQTTEATVSFTVESQALRDLPLNGRDVSQLIMLNPGVTQTIQEGGQAYNGYGRRISISGMRGEDNVYMMDGALLGDFRRHVPQGPSGALLGVETVQEFQVLTNSVTAQYGRVLGGVFNAVSKSGTNEWHGGAYDFLRNSALDARNFFDYKDFENDPRLPPFRRNQFGATLGGPIKEDKVLFFVGYESTRESLGSTEFATVPTANARLGILPTGTVTVNDVMKPYIAQYPLPSPNGRDFGDGTAEFFYQYSQPTTEHYGTARVDFPTLSDKDSLFVRFAASYSDQIRNAGFPGLQQVSSMGTRFLTLSETHIFSPTILNLFRVHFNRVVPKDIGRNTMPIPAGVAIVPGQSAPPEISPGSGINSIGGAGFATSPTILISNRFTYQDDVNLTLGKHNLQFGGFLERLQYNSSKYNRSYGVWAFTSLRNFLLGTVNTYRGAPPGVGIYRHGMRNWFMALYLTDNWRVTPKLTLDIGVRWEPYTVPYDVNGLLANLRHNTDKDGTVGDPYWKNKSWKDFGPRLGIAWSPFANGRTSVRAGFALMFSPNDPNQYYNALDRTPPLGFDYLVPSKQLFPCALCEVAASTTFGPTAQIPFDNNKSARALQYNFNIQQQLGQSNVISIGYAGSRGINLLSNAETNQPLAGWDGTSLYYRPTDTYNNPNYSSILTFSNDTNSWYNGLLMAYQRRFAAGFTGQVSYTFARALSEADEGQNASVVASGGGTLKYAWDHTILKSLSGYAFKNVLSFNYSYQMPFGKGLSGVAGKFLSGWQTTGILSVRSGQPISVQSAVSSQLTAIAVRNRSPNLVLGCSPKVLGGPDKYFNVNCYSAPGTYQLGNLGRRTLFAPGSVSWNPTLFKKTALTERLNLEFRAEFFNLLNRPNFGFPANSVFSGTGGRVGSAARITSTTTTSRQVQLALKLIF